MQLSRSLHSSLSLLSWNNWTTHAVIELYPSAPSFWNIIPAWMAEQENMVYAVFFRLAEKIIHSIQMTPWKNLAVVSKLSVASVARAQSRVGTTQCHCPDIRSEERRFRDWIYTSKQMDHEALTQNILKRLEGIFQDFKLLMYSDLGWICGRSTQHG